MNPKSFINKSPKSIKSHSEYNNFNFNNTNFNKNQTEEISLIIQLKSEKRDTWTKELKVSIKNSSSLAISITDNEDPSFLYKSTISESDFHTLKQAQQFLIDYQQFPSKISELLELCRENTNNNLNNLNSSILKSLSSFICVLDEKNELGEADLLIQEITQMRCLTHLKLPMKIPNDSLLKKHISTLCMDYKQKSEKYLDENKNLKEQIEGLTNKIAESSEEYKSFNHKKELEIKEIKLSHEKELMEIKNSHFEEIKNCSLKNSSELSNLEQLSKNEVERLRHLNQALTEKNNSLQESLNSTINDYKFVSNNESIANKELVFIKQENDSLRTENKELSSLRFNNEKLISELKIKLQSANEQLQDKNSIIQNNVNLIESLNTSKVSYLNLN